jgi:hypothetical protein
LHSVRLDHPQPPNWRQPTPNNPHRPASLPWYHLVRLAGKVK